jgi:cytochrome c2
MTKKKEDKPTLKQIAGFRR